MGRLLFKVAIFLLPVGLLFAFPAAVFLLAREGYLIQTAVRLQIEQPLILVGRAYTDADNTAKFYKTLLVQAKKPEVIALGSSRTMEFREEFFANPDSFVNASFSAANIGQIEEFVGALSVQNGVKVLLLGLDHRIFRPDYVPPGAVQDPPTIQKFLSDFFAYDWRWIYYDYARGRFSFIDLLTRNRNSGNIGLTALIQGDGYRGDGSYSYRSKLSDPDRSGLLENSINDTIAALKSDRNSFEYGPDISRPALESLDRTLTLAKDRDITVIGFLPPYAPALYQEMLSVDDEYRETLFELPEVLRTIFGKYGFRVYEFSDARVLGDTGEEYLDVDHPTDKLDLRMLTYMAKGTPALRAYVDINSAESLLERTDADFLPL